MEQRSDRHGLHLHAIRRYLTRAEIRASEHRLVRFRAEIEWHETLLADLPAIIEDERTRHQQDRSHE